MDMIGRQTKLMGDLEWNRMDKNKLFNGEMR